MEDSRIPAEPQDADRCVSIEYVTTTASIQLYSVSFVSPLKTVVSLRDRT